MTAALEFFLTLPVYASYHSFLNPQLYLYVAVLELAKLSTIHNNNIISILLNSVTTSRDVQLPYSGKLSREKTFMNFAILQPSVKVFSTKF